MSKHKFQTEVSQLLHLIIHSLYSHKEIFLRELISNASDALDKLKYLTLTNSDYKSFEFNPRIDVSFNKEDAILTIADSGVGMSKDELSEHLGTIARSGTKNFIETLSGDEKKDSNLIGQFGVGFYSSYMVADHVNVISRKVGEESAYKWSSDGKSGFTIEKDKRDEVGTTISLHLNDNGTEYTNRWSIEQIVKKYSNHISFPIYLHYTEEKTDDKDNKTSEDKIEQINAASAFWKRSKGSIKEKDYNSFYQSITNDYQEPMHYIHTQAEGALDYTTLFYIPKKAPQDMFQPDYQPGVKLYVKRVFITDDDKDLMPTYLRFLKGVIDTEDIPLNISREILQKNKILSKIRSNSVKKVLSELKKMSVNPVKYMEFYEQYGRPIKEGLYQDHENKELLLELVRFKSTKSDGLISFADYTDGMSGKQKNIFYITGGNELTLKNSPLLEMYKNKGVEVLILDDEIDEIIISAVPKYGDFSLKSVTHSDAAEDLKDEDDKNVKKAIKPLIKKIKKILGDQVKDVQASTRLTESPSCIVTDQNDPSVQMKEMMRAMGQGANMPDAKPILEINPEHVIVIRLTKMKKGKAFDNICQLLLDQALLVEGVKLENPAAFVGRLNAVLEESI
jgi:molecular chaperone HtpG